MSKKYAKSQLVHLYANGATEGTYSSQGGYSSNSYNSATIKEDDFFYNSLHQAHRFDNKKKVVFIVDDRREGGWGRLVEGNTMHELCRAFPYQFDPSQARYGYHDYINPSPDDWIMRNRDPKGWLIVLVFEGKHMWHKSDTKEQRDKKTLGNMRRYALEILQAQVEAKKQRKIFTASSVGTVRNLQWLMQQYITKLRIPKRLLKEKMPNKDISYKDIFYGELFTSEELHFMAMKRWAEEHGLRGSKEEKFAIFNDPEKKALRERLWKEKLEKEEQAREKARIEWEKEAAKVAEAKLEDWLAGKIAHIPNSYVIPVYLRITGIYNTVQTSKGASVLLADAEKAYHLLNRCIEKEGCERLAERIGGFLAQRVEKIGEEWYIRIGCHLISKSEADRFVRDNNLNWT